MLQNMSEMLRKLRKIDLSGCSFDEREFKFLSNFPSLLEIDLSDCHMATEKQVRLLCKLLEARDDVGSVSIKRNLKIVIDKQNRDKDQHHEPTLRDFKESPSLLDSELVKSLILSGL